MKRLALALVLALAAAGAAGATAPGDEVPFSAAPAAPVVLPPADTPNPPGSLLLPPDVFAGPPAVPEQRSEAELQDLWHRAGAAYGIPWQVLASINKIESNFGRNMGPSSAGAVGWMQFMPDTWVRWGLDASGDGVADPWHPEDAVYAAARYLAAAGGTTDLPRAVFAYNHAQWYVDQVLELAELYGQAGPDTAVELDGLEERLAAAEQAVVAANDAVVLAAEEEQRLRDEVQRLLDAAEIEELLSDRLALQQEAAQLDLRREEASAEVARLRAELAAAEGALAAARDDAQAPAFAPAAATLLAAPDYEDGYVFPVGGGPAEVSVPVEHHDYPAADIAAPAGAPVYALADSVVLDAWRAPDERCGVGLSLATPDGLAWTYCHLAYLEPEVVAGASLAAGEPVGLVGETGNASGPHLHLQLAPASGYPQDQPWFQSFAGAAFRWQEEEPEPAPAGPVFRVLPSVGAGEDLILFTR